MRKKARRHLKIYKKITESKVFKALGYDPKKVSGFAFGIGISRMVSQFYKANMRQLYGMDLQVLQQVSGRVK